MNTTTRFARFIAVRAIAAGIIGGAALGLAGTASAATSTHTTNGSSSIVATPDTKAHPAPSAAPGWYTHHGARHIADLNTQMGR